MQANAVVVGGGVVGLAIAKVLAEQQKEVILLEAAGATGTETSSRNSEIIHSGLYYPPGSLRAKLCVEGKQLLYAYCADKGVPHKQCGKLIVATDEQQIKKLKQYQATGSRNGVELQWLEGAQARKLEPALRCHAALLSPSTGVVDSHALMQAYQADAVEAGAIIALHSRVIGGDAIGKTKRIQVLNTKTGETSELKASIVVNAAGLYAQDVALSLGFPREHIPPIHFAKGNYFSLKGPAPFRHLIYPMPHEGGLGVHLTLDLAEQAKFGPDVEYTHEIEYSVNLERMDMFYAAIRDYWPGLPDNSLQAAFSGIRPKLHGPGEAQGDFVIQGKSEHGVQGVVNLFGIESPGLTSSLAIGKKVAQMLLSNSKL